VRHELLVADRSTARAAFRLEAGLPAVLVFGGSRGARSINQALVAALPDLLPRCQVIHVSGTLDWDAVSEAAGALADPLRARYHPYPYMHEEMIQALAAADLVVARAGASTLGEFPAAGVPSILVPYPYAGQHQDANAAYLAERGAALVIPDRDIANRLAATVLQLLTDAGRLAAMASAAAKLARPDAANAIARELHRLAGVSS
jgi:UDP-N-acetylglucosamine--N-acetylmuramyl-(pentapeptide) pyrophosphoryl-undecaprenol N-acetylglucosamine transferase